MSDNKSDKQDYHFLVVDDDNGSRTTIVDYLKAMGHARITVAKDGAEGIRMLDRDPSINFIISDWSNFRRIFFSSLLF